ncbi:MAG: Crp/Fnr family transcriptional regulator [Gammaproteobacteria bacterium]
MASEPRAIIGHGAQATALRRPAACDMCRLRAACLPDHIQDVSAARALSGLIVPGQPQARGTHLYRQGEPRRSFFLVRSGSAKSFRVNENGQEDVMGFHFPTDMIGAASLEHRQYTESVVLLERSTLCEVPAHELEVLLRNDAALLHSFFSKLAQSFEAERHARVRLHHASADERVADFLLELSTRFHAIGRDADTLFLSMSRYDIANYLGLAAETVSRALGRLQDAGVIAVKGKQVTLLARAALQDIAEHSASL